MYATLKWLDARDDNKPSAAHAAEGGGPGVDFRAAAWRPMAKMAKMRFASMIKRDWFRPKAGSGTPGDLVKQFAATWSSMVSRAFDDKSELDKWEGIGHLESERPVLPQVPSGRPSLASLLNIPPSSLQGTSSSSQVKVAPCLRSTVSYRTGDGRAPLKPARWRRTELRRIMESKLD